MTSEAEEFLCTRVSKEFVSASGNTITALSEMSFLVRRHEFVVLVGPSGCGKTTMLRLMAGLETPSSGSLVFRGEPISRPSRARGMVFQSHSLFPWLTVRGNVGWARPRDGEDREILRLVGLSEYADLYPSEISGGMQQRAALARTLAAGSDVLLLDEPLGALDTLTRETLQVELRRLHQRFGKTSVLVTHDLGEAVFIADRVLVMSARPGTVVAEQVLSLPAERDRRVRSTTEFLEAREELAARVGR